MTGSLAAARDAAVDALPAHVTGPEATGPEATAPAATALAATGAALLWAAYYGELAAAYGLTIDYRPHFRTEPLLQ